MAKMATLEIDDNLREVVLAFFVNQNKMNGH